MPLYLDMIIRKNMVMLENILTAPELDGILLGSDWGTQLDLIMSPGCFRKMLKPGELKEAISVPLPRIFRSMYRITT